MVPHKESGIGATKWTEGKCFYTMGEDYFLSCLNGALENMTEEKNSALFYFGLKGMTIRDI